MKKTKVLVFVGLLISMDIILTRFLSFQALTIRVDFGFIPVSMLSMLFGPVIGGIGAGLADILGMVVAPKGPYFPGLTLTALLRGVIFGLVLYKREKTFGRIAAAVLLTTIITDLGLNTLCLSMLYNKAVSVFLAGRLIKSAIMLPVQILMVYAVWNSVGAFVKNNLLDQ
jgi:ECF transporter S component (folate family)